MMQAREIIIELQNKTISALSWGSPDGKPILALHGWLDNAASFTPLAPYFKNFNFIAIDFPGHGQSSHIAPGSYFHIVDYAADTINIIDKLGWQKCAILGHSLGAAIGSIVAAIIPERITALGLIDGIGLMAMDEKQMPDLMRKSITEHANVPKKKLTHFANKDDAIQARLNVSKIKPASVELLVSRGLKNVDQSFMWSTDPKLLCQPLSMFTETQVEHLLNNITCKTCLLRPSPGWPFDENMFNTRINYIKDIQVHKINGDHHIHMDSPEIVGPLLEEFYNKTV